MCDGNGTIKGGSCNGHCSCKATKQTADYVQVVEGSKMYYEWYVDLLLKKYEDALKGIIAISTTNIDKDSKYNCAKTIASEALRGGEITS